MTSIYLAAGALYELIERRIALHSKQAAEAFLGAQGDHRDTRWDILLALTGALAAHRLHDRQLRQISDPWPSTR